MAQYTKQQLISASNAAYFTNVYGGISASAVRDLNDSWISSSALLSGSNTFIGNQIISGNLDISGTITASLQTGYLYVGNGSGKTQAVATSSIVTNINTGSFATTGSNVFFGSETFNVGVSDEFRVNWGSASSASMYTENSGGPNQTLNLNSASLYLNRGGLFFPSGSFTSQIGDMQFNAYPSASFTIRTQYGGNAILRANTDYTDNNRNYSYFQASPDGQISIVGKGDAVIITGSLGTTIQGLKYPSTDGTAGQVLTTDGSKNLTFTTITGSGGSTDTGSLLVTASFDNTTRDITFTKGDATTFKLGGFATTGSNTFTGNQMIVPASGTAITISGSTGFGYGIRLQGQQGISLEGSGGPRISFPNASWMNGNENDDFQFTGDTTNPLTRGMSFYLYGTGSRQMQFRNDSGPTANMAFQLNSGSMTFNAGSSISITGSSLTMQGFTYPTTDGTTGQALVTNGSKTLSFATVSFNTGSFATTGSNNFVGVETINNLPGTSVGEVYLLGRSGSLVLSNSTATPTYASLNHLSSSLVNGNTNIIFKTTTTAADTIISGSNNIFTNPTAPTAGFKRYIGGNGNLMLSPAAVNQISASQGNSIATNFNIHMNAAITSRGPVSASAWTAQNNMLIGAINIGSSAANNAEKILGSLTINQNQVGNALSIIANRTPISASTNITANAFIGGATTLTMASSSISYTANVGNAQITNGFQNGNAGVTEFKSGIIAQQNWFGAAIINVSGSDAGGPTNPRYITGNYLFNGFNLNNAIANLSLNGSGSSMLSTMLMGHELGITGSNGYDSNNNILQPGIGAGSAFFGRWNAQSGNRARTAETVFAVGTGTSTSLTKTGFLIDSGSNTFIEGTLNVSGSTTMTGSLTISSSATYDLTVIDSMQVSSSAGRVTIGTNGFVTTTPSTNVGSYVNVFSIAQSNTTTGDEFGFTLDTDAYGVSGWSGPAIYGNDTSDLYPAFLGFQNKSTYTDGRVTALTPLVTSGSLIANSYTILTSVSASLNFADDTAAAAGGVPLGGLYRNGNFVMIRLT